MTDPEETDQEYSDRMHRENFDDADELENDPYEDEELSRDDDDYEMQIECDACDGDGFQSDGKIRITCAECGGTGWV